MNLSHPALSSSANQQAQRWGRGAWTAFGFGLLVLIFLLFNFASQAVLPMDGYLVEEQPLADAPGQSGLFILGKILDRAAGLQPGDQILAVDGIPASQLIASSIYPSAEKSRSWDDSTVLTYLVQRGAERFEIKMSLFAPDPLAGWLALVRLYPVSGLFQNFSSLAFFIIGLVVFFLRPNERAAHALMIVGVAYLGNALPGNPSTPWYYYYYPLPIRWDSWDGAINPSLLYLLLAFPRPIGPLRRFPRLTVVFLYAWVPVLLQIAFLINPQNYAGFQEMQKVILGVSLLPLFAAVLVMVGSLFTVRDPVSLAQLKWMTAGIFGFVVVGIGGWAASYYLGLNMGSWVSALGQLGWLLMPICLAIAITRTRLFDIDIIIRRTLQYGALTVLLGLVYLGGVTLLQRIFSGEEQSPLAVVLSTLVIAALFNPLRSRVQSWIDLRFYRARYDSIKALELFSRNLRDEVDLPAIKREIFEVVTETIQPVSVSFWFRKNTKQ